MRDQSPIPVGWISLVRRCRCLPCLSLIHALEAADNPVSIAAAKLSHLDVNDVELRTLELIANGRSNKEIALALHESVRTTRNRLVRLYRMTGIHDRIGLTLMVRELGLATSPRTPQVATA